MKIRTLGILAGITIVGIIVAILINRDPASHVPNSGELVFPDLLPVVNEVHELVVATHEQTVTVVRGEQHWSVKEKDGYPADMEKVKETIIGLAEMRFLEPKTSNPELYDRLGLQEIEKEGAASTAVTVKSETNPEAAKVIVGNQRPSKGNPRLSDIYVRKPGDPQTWLVTGNLPLEKKPAEWLDKEITSIVTKRVQRATVTHPDGNTLVVSKANPEDLDFQLDAVPAGMKVGSQFSVNNVVGSLVQLSLEDVHKQEEKTVEPSAGVSAVVETFDGLRLHVHTAKQDDKVLGTFSAEFDPALVRPVNADPSTGPADPSTDQANPSGDQDGQSTGSATELTEDNVTPAEGTAAEGTADGESADGTPPVPAQEETVLKKPEEVQEEVRKFNQRVQGWTYELPAFKVENFSKTTQDLLSKDS